MKIEIHIHHHADNDQIRRLLRIERQLMNVTEVLTEVKTGLANLSTGLDKDFTEVKTKLDTLANGETTPEQDAIIADIRASLAGAASKVAAVDALIPDATGTDTPVDTGGDAGTVAGTRDPLTGSFKA